MVENNNNRSVQQSIDELTREVRTLRSFCNKVVVNCITNQGVDTDNAIKGLKKEIESLKLSVQNNMQEQHKLLEVAEPLLNNQIRVIWNGETIYDYKNHKGYTWRELEELSSVKACTLRKRYEKYIDELRLKDMPNID